MRRARSIAIIRAMSIHKMQWCMSYIRKAQDDQQASPPNANALTQRPIPLLTAMALL